MVSPRDAQDAPQAAHMGGAESFLLSGTQGPCFAAVQECTHDARNVHLGLGVLGLFAVCPEALCESGQCSGSFSDAPIEFRLEGEIDRDCGAEVNEPVHGLKL